MRILSITAVALIASSCQAFTSISSTPQVATRLNALPSEQKGKDATSKALASGFAAAVIASSMIGVPIAEANDYVNNNLDFAGSSELVAARSGGRAGGRARVSARPASRSAPTSRTTIINNRPPAVVSPTVVVSPLGYSPFGSPFGGFGMGYGLGAVNSIGNEIRDMNQEREIATERAELAASKEREAQLEQRLRALEQQAYSNPPAAVAPVTK